MPCLTGVLLSPRPSIALHGIAPASDLHQSIFKYHGVIDRTELRPDPDISRQMASDNAECHTIIWVRQSGFKQNQTKIISLKYKFANVHTLNEKYSNKTHKNKIDELGKKN